ncbi:MAG: DUF4199 domain-containing protein [Pedobacter sp.]|nr:MAG: DUF4199 domain-containing protein [Pedobacter sp.]
METVTTFNNAAVRKAAITNGLIWGAVSIVLFLVLYYVAPELQGNWVGGTLSFVISLALAIFFCIDMRKKAGGYWNFSQALLNIFIMFLIAAAVSYFFTIAFSKMVPEYAVKMKDAVMTSTEATYRSIGLGEDKISEGMAKLSEQLEKQFNPTPMQMITGFGIVAIMYFIGALIFAAIFKKTEPVFFKTEE